MTKFYECIETAVQLGREGCSCSESIACAFGRTLGVDDSVMLAGSSPMAGGMLCGQTCGVVAAALLILGLNFGPVSTDDHAGRTTARTAGSEFLDAFVAKQGSTLCTELCQGELSTPEGARAIRESGQPERLIRSGANILAGILSAE